jgi:hypothetical protein
MENISTYKRYLNKHVEFINQETAIEPSDYELTFPHSYDSSWTYKNVFIEAVKSIDFTGGAKAEFFSVISDSENNHYEKPVMFQQVENPEQFITLLDENTAGTYRLPDTALDKLIIKVTQTQPGTGRIIFVIRGL